MGTHAKIAPSSRIHKEDFESNNYDFMTSSKKLVMPLFSEQKVFSFAALVERAIEGEL